MVSLVSRAKPWATVFALFLSAVVANGSEAEEVVPRCDESPPQMTPPPYPEQLKGTSIGGVVVLILTLDSCGSVTNVGVERSSRNRELDRAAFEGAREWRFAPARDAESPELRRVRVPVDFTESGAHFMPDPDSAISSRARDDFFLQRRKQSAPDPGLATDGGIPGYVVDAYPIGVDTVAEGVAAMELHGRRQRDPAPSVRVYEISDEEGVSYWVLDESQPGRRALMRQRMVQSGVDTFTVTSWLCEPQGSDACSAYQAFLERMPSQPRFGALPPPPPAD